MAHVRLRNRNMFSAILMGTLIFLIGYKIKRGFILIPIGVRSLLNIANHPSDLFDPIVNDKFNLCETGFRKSYRLKPKYLDFYEIGILFGG